MESELTFKLSYTLLLVAADGNELVQTRLHESLRLWNFYVDLEESLGSLESTRAVYERILDLRIVTPQLLMNYEYFLEVGFTVLIPINYAYSLEVGFIIFVQNNICLN